MFTRIDFSKNGRKRFVKTLALSFMTIFMAGTIFKCGNNNMRSTRAILNEIGISRGICLLLGDVKGKRAIELAKKSELTIYVQLQRNEDVETARRNIDEAGYYGTRIFVGKGRLTKIHLADNIADALIAEGEATTISKAEVLRVLCPQGKALVGQIKYIKPFPKGVDDWSHPYHEPDNNPQSKDRIARAPYLTQFLAGPHYAPIPQMTVASAGRVFRALGHIAFKPREEAFVNTLVAYNGYNGTILWKRDLVPGIMVHRNTMIATPTILYVGDDKSCKLIDAATGELKDQISPPEDIAGGTFWKWMALENDILYALIGEQEMKDPEVRRSHSGHGWPWNPLSKGFNLPENPWGFGRNVLAIDLKTKKVIWSYHEDEPIDSRAVCMKNGQIYLFRFGAYLTCLNAKSGKIVWKRTKENDPEVFKELGTNLNRQGWQTNWRTTAYLKCSDKALYFSGPMMDKLIALSAKDGSVMWHHPYNNFQLVLGDDALYGISGPWGNNVSKKFDPLTGRVLEEFDVGRRACARPTGSADAIFLRANGGTVRFDLASSRPHYVSPMRPSCHDGVTIANGLLYWWPSVCDCQLTLYGATCLSPAGDFNFSAHATEAERLEKSTIDFTAVTAISESPADWPTFRGNNTGSVKTESIIFEKCDRLWQFTPKNKFTPTAPVTAEGMVFLSGSNGIVRALGAETGEQQWIFYTGGGVRISPTVWNSRVLAGSGDGWVYSLEARTGQLLWRFRAAPEERKIPVYGALLSTWPAASGVLVEDGIAYVAAGISNYDGIHVYALDAETGKIKWENYTSGHLNAEARTGVSVQGHLLLNDGKLYLAGGNAVSPAVYDIADGKCLNNGDLLNICESISLRGWELYLIGDKVAVGGQPFYGDPDYPVIDDTVFEKALHTSTGERDILWIDNKIIRCYTPIDKKLLNNSVFERKYPGHHIIPSWGKLDIYNKPLWERDCEESVALALCKNAVVVAKKAEIVAMNLQDGRILWAQPLPASPVPWGMAVDRDGRTIVTLENGNVLCFGQRN